MISCLNTDLNTCLSTLKSQIEPVMRVSAETRRLSGCELGEMWDQCDTLFQLSDTHHSHLINVILIKPLNYSDLLWVIPVRFFFSRNSVHCECTDINKLYQYLMTFWIFLSSIIYKVYNIFIYTSLSTLVYIKCDTIIVLCYHCFI